MDHRTVDGFAEPMIEEVARYLKSVSRGELGFDVSSDDLARLLGAGLAKVPLSVRGSVVQRLVSYGHYLDREQRATEASRTFMSGLTAAVGDLPVQRGAIAQRPKTWTFDVGQGRGRRSALRASRRVSLRGFRSF